MPEQFSRLRQGRAGAILDEAWDLYRSCLGAVLPRAALIACPVLAWMVSREAIPLTAWLDQDVAPTPWLGIFLTWFEGALILSLGALTVCAASLSLVVSAFTAPWSETSAGELKRRVRSRLWALLAGGMLVFILCFLTALSAVAMLATFGIALPGGFESEVFFFKLAILEGPCFVQLWLTGRLLLFPFPLVLEDRGLGGALKRSFRLTARRQFWPFMLALFFGTNLCVALASAAYALCRVLGEIAPGSGLMAPVLGELVFAALLLISAPLMVCVLTVSYFRARFIEEGLDLELAILSSALGEKYAEASYMQRHRVRLEARLKNAEAEGQDP